ncbi:MAG: CAP domain-containing protein [Candidatus Portnoybacteria bacterium]|nr:CAP domain-containing protein [Candidatus Portnoybacteria bacterium]
MSKIIEKLKRLFIPGEQNGFNSLALGRRPIFVYAAFILGIKILFLFFIFVFPKTDFFAAINSNLLVDMINGERRENNLEPLNIDSRLNEAAFMKAQDMFEQDYFQHSSPSGVTPWHWFEKVGYNYIWAGENLAAHFFDTQSVFDAWMESPSHRSNILNANFKDIGVAVASGDLNGSETTISVLEFGSSASVKSQKNIAQGSVPESEETKISSPIVQTKPQLQTETKTKEPEFEDFRAQKETAAGEESVQELIQAPLAVSYRQRVLGLAIFNLPEFLRNIYLYFAIFLAAALAVNIIVKIRIQKPATIALTLALIAISVAFIFV